MTPTPLSTLIDDLVKPSCPHCLAPQQTDCWVSVAKISDSDIITSWLCHACGMYFSVAAEYKSQPRAALSEVR